MATPQSQSERTDLFEDQKKIAEESEETSLEGTIEKKDITKALYRLYTEIEQIMQLVERQVIYDWDEYFMNVACLAALRSKDPRTPVGACIVTADNTIVGIGYNSMPYMKDGKNDHYFPWKGSKDYQKSKLDLDRKYPYVVHAAVNAITNKTITNLEGCTIYLTLYPDEDCAHAIIQSGISHVKYGVFIKRRTRTEMLDINYAVEMLRLQNVCCYRFETPREPQVTVTAGAGNDIQISLSKRLYEKDIKDITSSEPEKDLILTWEQFFMSIAMLSAKKLGSHEKYPEWTQGACIVSEEDKQVISVGFSGYPESMNPRAVQKVTKNNCSKGSYICHAEYDAILSKGTPSVKGCTLYVTKYPCNMCAKLIVQSGIKEVVYLRHGKGKLYVASRRILTAALAPKEEDPIKETAREVIELMVNGIYNIKDPTESGTKITVKRAFQIILTAALAPKEEDPIKETAREVIELMVTGINNIMDPTEGGTKITVKRAFQIILAAALAPKKEDPIKETVRKVIELIKSGLDNNTDQKAGGTKSEMVKHFQSTLEAALPPMKEIRKFEEVKDLELQVNENHSKAHKKKTPSDDSTSISISAENSKHTEDLTNHRNTTTEDV